jgi:hypothetical protein
VRSAALIVLGLAACGGAPAAPRPFAAPLPVYHEGERLVVVGDLQRTAPLLELWREQNDAERQIVVRAIADARPDLVAITGDCVFDGGSDAQWQAFDALAAPLRALDVPAIAAFGNHEYWAGRDDAEAHLFPRFPLDSGRHWFVVSLGPLRLVVLDSNRDRLGDADWGMEMVWYERTLAELDADAGVRGVLVLEHHPAYTNSTVTGDEPHVQRFVVPPLLRARKTLGLVTGHVHSYERFERGGKTFVVSGGGGGPRAELLTGADRRHPDDRYAGPALRDFHFTVYTVTGAGVSAEVRGLPKGGTRVAPIDRFTMPWP